jgi:hypothetical protein
MVGMREAPALQARFPYVDVFMPPSDTAPLLDFLHTRGLVDGLRHAEQQERAWRDAVLYPANGFDKFCHWFDNTWPRKTLFRGYARIGTRGLKS